MIETHTNGMPVSAVHPIPVRVVEGMKQAGPYSAAVTLITGAAGFTGQIQTRGPILNLTGDKVGSHWRKNPVWGVKTPVQTTAVVETAGSAAFNVYDPVNNLEELFEGVGVGKFIARLTIDNGSEIYGYIGGVSVASDVYTFTVFNGAALGTQDWIGSLPTGGAVRKLEIFSNQSSLVWTTGAILTREVPWESVTDEQQTVADLLATMANGDFAINYDTGAIAYKKATAGTTDTATYNTYTTFSVAIDEFPAAAAITDAFANPTTTNVMAMQMLWNGSTWDRWKGNAAGGGFVQGAIASGATDSGNPVKVGGKYNATLPTFTDGQRGDLQIDDKGMLVVTLGRLIAGENQTEDVLGVAQKLTTTSSYAYTPDISTALEASSIIKASAGNLYKLTGRIDQSAATRTGANGYFIHVVDSATVPADGAVSPIFSKKYVHTNGTDTDIDLDFGTGSIHGDNGLVVYVSTTEFTKTITGAILSLNAYFK